MYPFLDLGFIDYPTYGLCALVGIIISAVLMYFLARKRRLDASRLLGLILAGFVGALVFGRLLYALTVFDEVSKLFSMRKEYSFLPFLSELMEVTSGLVFYGGLYGGLLSGFLFAKLRKIETRDFFDVFAVGIPAFHIFGRVGCFFAGCCYGVRSDFGFSGRVLFEDVREKASRFPVQLLEAAVLFILTAVLFFLFTKGIFRGKLMMLYLLIYASLRFVIEYFRGDELRGSFLWFSTSQWISLATIGVVSLLLLMKSSKKKKVNT